jgi:uncharacterized protein YceH (UPF0502 family)
MSDDRTPFDRGMEIWERMSASYMDTMTKAVEKTMEQSAALRKQVDKAVATAMSAQLEATLAAIKALEQQVQLLSAKVDQLLQK